MFFLIQNIACILIIFIALFYTYKVILFLFAPFIYGYILSKVLRPLVILYNKKFKLKNELSSALALITFVVLFSTIVTLIINAVVSQVVDVYENSEAIANEVTQLYDKFKNWYDSKMVILPNAVKEPMEKVIKELYENSLTYFSNVAKELPQKTFAFSKSFIGVTFIGTISSFFFMKYSDVVDKTIKKYTPNFVKRNLFRVRKSGLKVITSYFSTQLKLMSIVFVLVVIVLSILRIKYFLLFAIGIAVIDVLPFFGSGFFLWPMTVYYGTQGEYKTSIALMALYLVILLTRQFLEPRLLGEKLEVNPILTLMAMYVGLKILGFLGLLLGPFTLILIKHIMEHKDEIKS